MILIIIISRDATLLWARFVSHFFHLSLFQISFHSLSHSNRPLNLNHTQMYDSIFFFQWDILNIQQNSWSVCRAPFVIMIQLGIISNFYCVSLLSSVLFSFRFSVLLFSKLITKWADIMIWFLIFTSLSLNFNFFSTIFI